MEKNILFVCCNQSFMVNAIINSIEKMEYQIKVMKPEVTSISRLDEIPSIIMLYLDGVVDNSEYFETMVYLKDKVQSSFDSHLMYLVGTLDELDYAKKVIPEKVLLDSFLRPINVKEMAEKLDHDLNRESLIDHKKRILVIDDDTTMLNTLKEWLSAKYQVFMADSGMSGISLLARHKVDLILLDYEMPVISGAKVLEMIRSDNETSNIPVMFLTAKQDRQSVMEVVKFKPERYLLKTLPPSELINIIDEFFMRQQIS